ALGKSESDARFAAFNVPPALIAVPLRPVLARQYNERRCAGVASKDHADQTLFYRHRVTDFELRFVPAARDPPIVPHRSWPAPGSGKEGRSSRQDNTIGARKTGDASQPEQPERNRNTLDSGRIVRSAHVVLTIPIR